MNSNELKELTELCTTLGIKNCGALEKIKKQYSVQSNGEMLALLETMAADLVA